MSNNLNKAGGSPNVSIDRVREGRTAAEQARSGSDSAFGFFDFSNDRGCTGTSDCAQGEACVDGQCVNVKDRPSGELNGPGNCHIDPPNRPGSVPEDLCQKPGGCTEVGVGDCNLDKDDKKKCCGPVYRGVTAKRVKDKDGKESIITTYTEQCEPIKPPCDDYADFWYKATGDIPSPYSVEDVCSSCQECQQGLCQDIWEPLAPCYCNDNSCSKEGPCYECDIDTGDCQKTCNDCQAINNEFFTCPCDSQKNTYEATCSLNPCENYVAGPGGTCFQQVFEEIKSFCERNHPCPDPEDSCMEDCVTLKGSGQEPACPDGNICKSQGFMTNEETGETTFFLQSCGVKPDCGCDADPGSDLFTPCGNCQICDNGKCIADPRCGFRFQEAGRYEVEYTDFEDYLFGCTKCDGSPTLINGSEPYCKDGPRPKQSWSGCQNLGEIGGCTNPTVRSRYYSTAGLFAYAASGSRVRSSSCSGGPPPNEEAYGSITRQEYYHVNSDYDGTLLFTLLATLTSEIRWLVGTYSEPRSTPLTGFREVNTLGVRKTGDIAQGDSDINASFSWTNFQNLVLNADYNGLESAFEMFVDYREALTQLQIGGAAGYNP